MKNGKLDFDMIWPAIYCIPFCFEKIPWITYQKVIQKYIEVVYIRMKDEVAADVTFKTKMEKSADCRDFINSLRKLHRQISPD
mmetsp:Transcript_28299/g.25085  ORF Transcript_28299/g.25085 Transcript_28299/m.25085 type:complete len:83 (+) Transcript_28299:788-1036(+)